MSGFKMKLRSYLHLKSLSESDPSPRELESSPKLRQRLQNLAQITYFPGAFSIKQLVMNLPCYCRLAVETLSARQRVFKRRGSESPTSREFMVVGREIIYKYQRTTSNRHYCQPINTNSSKVKRCRSWRKVNYNSRLLVQNHPEYIIVSTKCR